MTPPAGARKGLPYNAAAVPLWTTRADLPLFQALFPGVVLGEVFHQGLESLVGVEGAVPLFPVDR